MTTIHLRYSISIAILLVTVAACASPPPDSDTGVRWVCDTHPDRVEFLFASLDLGRAGLEGVAAAVERGDWPAACDELISYYRYGDSGGWLRLDVPLPSPSGAGAVYATEPKAEKIMADDFEFNSVEATVPRTETGGLDWTYRGPDDALSWSLGLHVHAHLNDLILSYLRTGNPEYVRRVDAEIIDWVTANPYPNRRVSDANWQSLNTANRIRQWNLIFYRMQDIDEFSAGARILMLSSIPEHAHDLRNYHKPRGNWLVGAMLGLGEIAVSWPEFRDSPAWLEYASDVMIQQMDEQVYDDGAHKELTATYHRKTAMHFETFIEVLGHSDRPIDPLLTDGLESLWNYLAHTLRPNGFGPLNNDGDYLSMVPHLERAIRAYGRSDWEYIVSGGREGEGPGTLSVAFPWAGQVVMRNGWGGDAHWSFFDAGPWGMQHQHDDKLHLSVSAYGRDLLVDAGRYTYQSDAYREYFTGSSAHNVILFDGHGQRSGAKVVESPLSGDWCVIKPDFDYAWGAVENGFEGADTASVHERGVMYVRDRFWIVVDRVKTEGPREVEVLWRFHPQCAVAVDGMDAASTDPGLGNLRISPVGERHWDVRVAAGQEEPRLLGWYSASLNVKKPAPTAVYSTRVEGPATFVWVLTPARGATRGIDASIVSLAEDGAEIRVRVADVTATLPLGNGQPALSR